MQELAAVQDGMRCVLLTLLVSAGGRSLDALKDAHMAMTGVRPEHIDVVMLDSHVELYVRALS